MKFLPDFFRVIIQRFCVQTLYLLSNCSHFISILKNNNLTFYHNLRIQDSYSAEKFKFLVELFFEVYAAKQQGIEIFFIKRIFLLFNFEIWIHRFLFSFERISLHEVPKYIKYPYIAFAFSILFESTFLHVDTMYIKDCVQNPFYLEVLLRFIIKYLILNKF